MRSKFPLYLSDGRVIRRVTCEEAAPFVAAKKWKPRPDKFSGNTVGFDVVDYEHGEARGIDDLLRKAQSSEAPGAVSSGDGAGLADHPARKS